MVICENVKRKIIPIASGKGGVGKTFLAANLSLAIARSGKSTVVVDLDLGGSNLHTCFGMKNTHAGIGNFLSDGNMKFADVVQRTPYDNLRFVAGDVLVSCVADVQFSQRRRLITNILELDADYILIDLGSGSGSAILDYFLISNSGFVVSTTQTVSILNAYSFLKNLVFRFLTRALASNKTAAGYFRKIVKEKRPDSAPSCPQIIDEIQGHDRETGERIRMYLSVLKPKLVLNMVKSPEDLAIVDKLRDTVQKNLMIDLECMGIVFDDPQVDASLAEHTPLVALNGDSLAAKEIDRIALRIVQSDRFPELPLDFSYYKDSFELAQIEAKYDFEELSSGPQEKGGEEPEKALENLLAVITEQRKEINSLRGTVRMLTMKGGQGPGVGLPGAGPRELYPG